MEERYVIIYDTFNGEYDRITQEEFDNIRPMSGIIFVGYDWGNEL